MKGVILVYVDLKNFCICFWCVLFIYVIKIFVGDVGILDVLDYFIESFVKFIKFSGFRCLVIFSYVSDIYSSFSIVLRLVEVLL